MKWSSGLNAIQDSVGFRDFTLLELRFSPTACGLSLPEGKKNVLGIFHGP